MFFSPTTSGFYSRDIHGSGIPFDAAEITQDQYQVLVDGQSAGKQIAVGADGLPILVDPPPIDHRAAVAAARYLRETAGITINGIGVDTSRDSQALITGAALSAMLDPGYVCRWKTPAGFVELTADQILGVATAVRAHVQACFDREAAILAEIEAGTYDAAMLKTGWPA